VAPNQCVTCSSHHEIYGVFTGQCEEGWKLADCSLKGHQKCTRGCMSCEPQCSCQMSWIGATCDCEQFAASVPCSFECTVMADGVYLPGSDCSNQHCCLDGPSTSQAQDGSTSAFARMVTEPPAASPGRRLTTRPPAGSQHADRPIAAGDDRARLEHTQIAVDVQTDFVACRRSSG